LWVVPSAGGRLGDIDLSVFDPADPDDRGILVRAEHPEFEDALRRDLDEVLVPGGHRVNPRLHLALHEVVANQLWDDDPPEVWQAAQRLVGLGYQRHEILHMLASTMSDEMWHGLRRGKLYDHSRHVQALRSLPASWETLGHDH